MNDLFLPSSERGISHINTLYTLSLEVGLVGFSSWLGMMEGVGVVMGGGFGPTGGGPVPLQSHVPSRLVAGMVPPLHPPLCIKA